MKKQGKATTAVYQDAAIRKDGTQTIYLRLTIDRKWRAINTGVSIPAKFWDKERQVIKTNILGLANARQLASKVADLKARLDKAILDLEAKGETVTFPTVERRMEAAGRTRLIDYCLWRAEAEAPLRTKGTVVSYYSAIKNLKAFAPDALLADVTPRWLEEWHEYLAATGRFSRNTIVVNFKYLKKIIHHAKRHGDIDSNPFERFRPIRWKQIEKAYLTREELTAMMQLYRNGGIREKNPAMADVLHRFLASCFCGLRFSDISRLQRSDLVGDHISIVMRKTQDPLRIPLNAPMRELIGDATGEGSLFPGRAYCNSYTNATLARLVKMAGIEKRITFHSARHTFAIMALEVGMPIEVVSSVLGHTSIQVTQIYARVVDLQKRREMAKMDNLV